MNRFPKNVQGDFYTTGTKDINGQWCSDCMACDLPENEARDLMAPLEGENYDTYFVRQPNNLEEIAQAIGATEVCCVDAVRYGGKDKDILRRVHPSVSDFKLSIIGSVVPSTNKWWKLW